MTSSPRRSSRATPRRSPRRRGDRVARTRRPCRPHRSCIRRARRRGGSATSAGRGTGTSEGVRPAPSRSRATERRSRRPAPATSRVPRYRRRTGPRTRPSACRSRDGVRRGVARLVEDGPGRSREVVRLPVADQLLVGVRDDHAPEERRPATPVAPPVTSVSTMRGALGGQRRAQQARERGRGDECRRRAERQRGQRCDREPPHRRVPGGRSTRIATPKMRSAQKASLVYAFRSFRPSDSGRASPRARRRPPRPARTPSTSSRTGAPGRTPSPRSRPRRPVRPGGRLRSGTGHDRNNATKPNGAIAL